MTRPDYQCTEPCSGRVQEDVPPPHVTAPARVPNRVRYPTAPPGRDGDHFKERDRTMPAPHRRTMFAAIPAAVLALRTPAARAQTAAAPAAQAPGFYRFKIGSFEVTMLNDGFFSRPVAGLVRNIPDSVAEQAARDAFLPVSPMPIPFTITVVRTPRALIAFDAGTGGMAPSSGLLAANMRAAGIDPAEIDLVAHSHFHADHITGLLGAADAVVFPKAEIAVPAAEWAFWTDESNTSRVQEFARGTFANVRRRFAPYQARLRQFQDGAELAPGIRAIAAPGHTPGHACFLVADGNDQLLVLGDITNRPELFVRNPGWHAVFDMDAAMAEQSRRRMLDRAAADRIRVSGYHFPFPANGYVAREGEGFRFVLANWSSAV